MPSINSLLQRQQQLADNISRWEQIIASSPDGTLIARSRNNDRYEYTNKIRTDNNKVHEIYIPKGNHDFARKLALKDYAVCALNDAELEKSLLDRYISSMTSEKNADKFLRLHPGAAKLLMDSLNSRSDFIRKWSEADYVRSKNHLVELKFSTVVPGLYVRSKSESLIISRMVHFGVPFRYEEEHIINGITVHIDITGLNLTSLKPVYWEHQGAWDKPSYIEDALNRQKLLAQGGIIPWKNLIITTETLDQPLDINWVDEIIQYYYL